MILILASVRNVGTCRPDAKGEAQADSLCEARVPMRGTGAETPVGRVDGSVVGSDRRGVVIQLYLAIRKGMTALARAKPYCTVKREVWEAYKQVKAGESHLEIG